MDGVGEWATTSTGVGRGSDLTLTEEIRFPHSLGMLYSAFTYYLTLCRLIRHLSKNIMKVMYPCGYPTTF